MSALTTEAAHALLLQAQELRSCASSYRKAWRSHRQAADQLNVALLKLTEEYGADYEGAPEAVRKALEGYDAAGAASEVLVELETDDVALEVLEGEARALEDCAQASDLLARALMVGPGGQEGGAA